MSGAIETPIKTPKQNVNNECLMSTPLFVPPTPSLKQLGYGTGKLTSLCSYISLKQTKINRKREKKTELNRSDFFSNRCSHLSY